MMPSNTAQGLRSASLVVSSPTFLPSICVTGVVFTWLLNVTGISVPLTGAFITGISLCLYAAWRAPARDLRSAIHIIGTHVLPAVTISLATCILIAENTRPL